MKLQPALYAVQSWSDTTLKLTIYVYCPLPCWIAEQFNMRALYLCICVYLGITSGGLYLLGLSLASTIFIPEHYRYFYRKFLDIQELYRNIHMTSPISVGPRIGLNNLYKLLVFLNLNLGFSLNRFQFISCLPSIPHFSHYLQPSACTKPAQCGLP